MLKAWDEETPPQQTWVAARYGVMEPDHIVKTCKHGCCVIDPLCGSMVLPKYWRLATDDEVRSVLPRPKTPNARISTSPIGRVCLIACSATRTRGQSTHAYTRVLPSREARR